MLAMLEWNQASSKLCQWLSVVVSGCRRLSITVKATQGYCIVTTGDTVMHHIALFCIVLVRFRNSEHREVFTSRQKQQIAPQHCYFSIS